MTDETSTILSVTDAKSSAISVSGTVNRDKSNILSVSEIVTGGKANVKTSILGTVTNDNSTGFGKYDWRQVKCYAYFRNSD